MPLTHVCTFYPKIGYRRITAEDAGSMFPDNETVSAKSGHFVCELCEENVCFTARGTGDRSKDRHFRHEKDAQNKECEERQKTLNRPLGALNSHAMPLRISIENSTFVLQLGFFVPGGRYKNAIHFEKIHISGDGTWRYEYASERINTTGISYLDVGNIPTSEYTIEYIRPSAEVMRYWPSVTPGVPPSGALFDCNSGKMLQAGGKAYVGNSYYLLQRGLLSLGGDLSSTKITEVKTAPYETWQLYKIDIRRISPQSAQFFLKRSIFLTERPVEFYPIWPACVQEPYFIYYEESSLYFYLCGSEAELKTYPVAKGHYAPKSWDVKGSKLVNVHPLGNEQLLSLGASGALGFAYLQKRELTMVAAPPPVTITDCDGEPMAQEQYTSLPKGKRIIVSAPFDGKIVCLRGERTEEIRPLSAGRDVVIDALSYGMEIQVFQGRDCVRYLRFEEQQAYSDAETTDRELVARLAGCHGYMTDVPHSVGAVAKELSRYSRTKQWLQEAIRRGEISNAAYWLLVDFHKTRGRRHDDEL